MEGLVILVFGICLILAAIWYAPIPEPIKSIALCVLCLAFGLYLLGGHPGVRWR
jgi:hypothetical protein